MTSQPSKVQTLFHFVRRAAYWAWRGVRMTVFIAFATVAILGLVRAWTVRGVVDDRRAEMLRLKDQLVEAEIRGQELRSGVEAFANRPDVRMQAIRKGLGMLRDHERYYVFK